MNRVPNRFSRIAGLAAYFILAASIISGCSSAATKTEEQKQAEQDPLPTQVFSLQKGKLSSVIHLPGELIAYQQVDLYAKVNSFVSKLYVDIGSEVKEGQLLVTMEAPELNAELQAAASRLKSQEALYIASKSNYDRLYETSQTPGTVSQNDIDQALAKKNSDLAQLEAAKSAYQEIEDTKKYLEIRAPFNGVISSRNVNTGAYVGPSGKGSDMPIFTLQEQKKLRLVISVPEAYTSYINDRVRVDFEVRSLPNNKFTATVKRLAGALDDRLRSERIEMDVENNHNLLLPGMVAEVIVPLPGSDSTFIVPKSAFVNSTEKMFVIRVADEKAEWVDVKKGREDAGMLEVYGSLSPGDSLIKTASEEIRNGSSVKHVTIVK
jgi:membrane fusion protein, multidrug efflux system